MTTSLADLRPASVVPVKLDVLRSGLQAAGHSIIDAPTGSPRAGATEIGGVCQSSASVRPGELYVARAGARAHGASFSRQAAERGAVAVLTDPAGAHRAAECGLPVVVVQDVPAAAAWAAAVVYGRPASSMHMYGITGTNGKTTSAYVLEAALLAAGRRPGVLGTVAARWPGTEIVSARTTPEATELHAVLACMRDADAAAAVMEVSSHALELGRVEQVMFDVAVFTNLTQDHLDFHPDMESYFLAKAKLFTSTRARHGVINRDDAWAPRLLDVADIPCDTFSIEGRAADWQATQVVTGAHGTTFRLVGPGVDIDVATGLVGRFNVSNTVGALVALARTGVPLESALPGLSALTGAPGRLERIEGGQPFLALVDYAHTPDAVETVLATVRETCRGKVLVVLGCGGDRDAGKRPLMAEAATRLADTAVFTSDNPRSEDPALILAQMVDGAVRTPLVIEDRRAAIEHAVRLAGPQDVVVIAGKGHETGQDVGGVVTPFDDRLELARAIRSALPETVA